jgi:hypothetical protein
VIYSCIKPRSSVKLKWQVFEHDVIAVSSRKCMLKFCCFHNTPVNIASPYGFTIHTTFRANSSQCSNTSGKAFCLSFLCLSSLLFKSKHIPKQTIMVINFKSYFFITTNRSFNIWLGLFRSFVKHRGKHYNL